MHTHALRTGTSYILVLMALMGVAGSMLMYATPLATLLVFGVPALIAASVVSRHVIAHIPWVFVFPFQIVFGILFGLMGILIAAPAAILGMIFVRALVEGEGVRSVVGVRP